MKHFLILLLFLVTAFSGNAQTGNAGLDLGLEGAEIQHPGDDARPAIKAVNGAGGRVHIDWKKAGFDAIEIWKQADDGEWAFLSIDTTPDYIDTYRYRRPAARRQERHMALQGYLPQEG